MQQAFIRSAIAAALLAASQASTAALEYDQDVTPDVIQGSGNANGSFTVERANGVELGLRGKLRHNAAGAPENTFNSNGDGTYSFDAGVAPTQAFPTAVWSFDWSINTNWDDSSSWNLADLTYSLGLDLDPSLGTSYIAFDPINDANPGTGGVQWDHAIGDNTTGNGAGTSIPNASDDVPGYASLIGDNNVAQNSWKAHWFFGPGFDPTVDGTYNIYLSAFNASGDQVARTDIQIIAGAGATATVPLPGTFLLFGLGLAGLGFAKRKTRA